MKKLMIAVAAALALTGCTQAAPAPTVTVTAQPPAPVAPPAPETNDFVQGILQEAWDTFSPSEKADMCFAFNALPDEAWQAFNEGAEGLIPRSDYDAFFSVQCSAY